MEWFRTKSFRMDTLLTNYASIQLLNVDKTVNCRAITPILAGSRETDRTKQAVIYATELNKLQQFQNDL